METPKYTKEKIPKALREQAWLRDMGKVYDAKCKVRWCQNTITVFDFQCGHNVPESKGGATHLTNIVCVCARCNSSMGNQYTIDEWNKLGPTWVKRTCWSKLKFW